MAAHPSNIARQFVPGKGALPLHYPPAPSPRLERVPPADGVEITVSDGAADVEESPEPKTLVEVFAELEDSDPVSASDGEEEEADGDEGPAGVADEDDDGDLIVIAPSADGDDEEDDDEIVIPPSV